jgi:hypothetical protein
MPSPGLRPPSPIGMGEGQVTRRRNLSFDRIYGMNGIRRMNGLNSVAKGMVYSEEGLATQRNCA